MKKSLLASGLVFVLLLTLLGCEQKQDTSTPSKALLGIWEKHVSDPRMKASEMSFGPEGEFNFRN